MTAELFPPDSVAVDSPRLAWLKAQGIRTKERGGCWTVWQEAAPMQPITAQDLDDALAQLAARLNIKTWNE